MATVSLEFNHTDTPGMKSVTVKAGETEHTIDEVPLETLARGLVALSQVGFTSHLANEDQTFVLTSPDLTDEQVAEIEQVLSTLFQANAALREAYGSGEQAA
jgi:hypothetical protein